MKKLWAKVQDYVRVSPLAFLAVAGLAVIAVFAAQQIGVILYKATIIATSGYGGYWIDRVVFPYARPHEVDNEFFSAAMIRRAVIVAATILAGALAL